MEAQWCCVSKGITTRNSYQHQPPTTARRRSKEDIRKILEKLLQDYRVYCKRSNSAQGDEGILDGMMDDDDDDETRGDERRYEASSSPHQEVL
jgi:hypothetical protein